MKDTNDRQQSNSAATPQRKRVPLGMLLITPGAQMALAEAEAAPLAYLFCHGSGDWDEVGSADAAEIDLSLREGFRILSAYTIAGSVRI